MLSFTIDIVQMQVRSYMQCWSTRVCSRPSGTIFSVNAKRLSRICHTCAHPPWLSRNEQISAWFVIPIKSWSDLEGNQVELVSQKKESVLGGPSCGRD